MARLELPVPVDQLISTSKVEVVQTLNAEALHATLQWIVDHLNKLAGANTVDTVRDGEPDRQQLQQEQLTTTLQQLKDRNAELEDAVGNLQAQQDALQSRLASLPTPSATTEPDANSLSPPALDTSGLEARLSALERQLQDAHTAAGPNRSVTDAESKSHFGSGKSDNDATPVTLHPGGSTDQLADVQQRLGDLEARLQHTPSQQVAGGTNSDDGLAERMAALESRLAQLEAANPQGNKETAGSFKQLQQEQQPSVQLAHDGEQNGDLQRAVQDLQAQLSCKADQSALDALANELRKNRPSTPQVVVSTASSDVVPAVPAAGGNNLVDADTERLTGRVFDLETAMGDLGAAVQQLQGGLEGANTRLQGLADQVEGQDVALAGKADQAAVDLLKLQLALMRPASDGAAAAQGSSSEGVHDHLLGALHDLVADKATKAEVEAVRRSVLSRPTQEEVKQMLAGLTAAARPSTPQVATLASPRPSSLNAAAGAAAGPAEVLNLATGAVCSEGPELATKAELDMLTQQVGDLYADLSDIRGQLYGLQQAHLATGLPADSNPAAQGSTTAALPVQIQPANAPADQLASSTSATAPTAAPVVSTQMAVQLPLRTGSQMLAAQSMPDRGGGLQALAVQQLQQEVAGLKDQLEWVAHAAGLMAVGQQGLKGLHTIGTKPNAVAGNTASTGAGADHNKAPHGSTSRLVQLLQGGRVGHKMDWFDPDALNKLAGKLALVEDMTRRGTPASAMSGNSPPADVMMVKDLEAQVRRLSKDVRGLRDRVGDGSSNLTGLQGGLLRNPDSDYAMLSGKKLLDGYRCMACDRPLDKLQDAAGPHIPTGQMPVRVPPSQEATKVAQLRVPVVGHVPTEGASSPVNKFVRKPGFDAATQRGPQNWYEDSKGLPAESLPAGDVGPRLPPGGWRAGSVPGAPPKPGSLLPDLTPSPPASAAASSKPRAASQPQPQPQQLEVQDHTSIHAGLLPSLM